MAIGFKNRKSKKGNSKVSYKGLVGKKVATEHKAKFEDVSNKQKSTKKLTDDFIELVAPKVFIYIEKVYGIELFPYQKEFAFRVIQAVIRNEGATLTALFSRQSGKTETIADVISALLVILPIIANLYPQYGELHLFTGGFWVGIFAPVKDQADTTYDRMRSRMMVADEMGILNEMGIFFECKNGNTISLSNGSILRSTSASDKAKIESKTYHLVIIEECQEVSDMKVNKSIVPMTAFYNGNIVKIGTAFTVRGNFYYSIEFNKLKFAKNQQRDHFEYDWEVCALYNPYYEKYVKNKMEEIGKDSDEFQMSFCLTWILERGTFITVKEYDKLLDDNMGLITKLSDSRFEMVFGIDLGKTIDSTVVTAGMVDTENPVTIGETNFYHIYILNWLELHGDNYISQYKIIEGFVRSYDFPHKRIVVDTTNNQAFGDLLVNELGDEYSIIPFNFSSKAKSEGYKYLQREIFSHRVHLPGDKKARATRVMKRFENQFLTLEKDYNGETLICEAPNKKHSFDDYCDSLMLCVFGIYAEVEDMIEEIEVEDTNIFYNTQGQNNFVNQGVA